ncbi:MAG: N-acetylmuramoyl-L-alanine amidase [Paracoccaceae bacterium]|nr:N-acetylmuramoyl-L-alanine amidase [Paracoccaceae bacterium]
MGRIAIIVIALAIALAGGATAQQAVPGQKLQGLARLDAAASLVRDTGSGDVQIALALSQAVPYRVFTLANPVRLVIDFREVRFPALTLRDLVSSRQVSFVRTGLFRPGWSRMVLGLKHPVRVASAAMRTDPEKGTAVIRIRLEQETPEAFLREVGPGKSDFWALPEPAVPVPGAKGRPKGRHKLLVALDPGHGGMDPGAQYQGHTEAGLMLTLARELKERLVRTGRYDVFLTRNEDVFLSLQGRVSLARAAGADVFISLHADALAQGTASGTTVYTLSAEASDKASAWLAASHDRDDLLAGVDLQQQDDVVASVLMDMARTETLPRAEKLADAIVKGVGHAVGRLRARPRLKAGFSVLKAPDIPSVLVEFGFMSNPHDLALLTSPVWRAKMIDGMVTALDEWAVQDAAEARLRRR